MWVQFAPNAAEPKSWQMYKLGQPISPLDVVYNGSRSLHVVSDEGISVRGTGDGAWEQLNIRSGLKPLCGTIILKHVNPFPPPATAHLGCSQRHLTRVCSQLSAVSALHVVDLCSAQRIHERSLSH